MTGEIFFFFAIKDLRLEEIKNNIKSLKNIINLALNVIQEPKFYEESLIEIQRRKEYPKNIENSIKKITKSLKKQWNNEILKRKEYKKCYGDKIIGPSNPLHNHLNPDEKLLKPVIQLYERVKIIQKSGKK